MKNMKNWLILEKITEEKIYNTDEKFDQIYYSDEEKTSKNLSKNNKKSFVCE